MFDVKKIKADFPIYGNYKNETGGELVYLDSAATSQTPKRVVDAMDDYYFKYRSNIHRSSYDIGETASERYEEAREVLARFVNAEKDEIIFTGGATASSNMLIYALEQTLPLNNGDEIVTTIFEHHSNLLPLQELAKRRGLTLKHIEVTPEFRLDYGVIPALITDKTKIISVTLASNVTGTIHDVRRVADEARKHGAIFIVDATAAAGHMPIDAKALGADFLFFSGHKMCGPTGIGVLYGRKEILEKMKPSFFGGGMVEDVTMKDAEYNDVPMRFEAGTPNIAGVIGFSEAVKYLNNLKIENIQKHAQNLVAYAVKKLSEIGGVTLVCEQDPKQNIGIVSFVVNGIHPHDIGEILNRSHVAIRGGHHCALPLIKAIGETAVNRASFYLYNNESDVDALAEGIKEAQKIFSYSLLAKR